VSEGGASARTDEGRAGAAWLVYALVLVSGSAALSWEVLWQLEASLAIGVSAKGTAIALAATMGGMSIGSTIMGRVLQRRVIARPLRIYGSLEIVVALAGLTLLPAFRLVERLDGAIYEAHPVLAPVAHLAAILAVLGPATLAMGATIPVFGLLARTMRSSIATLYAVNTAGAATGVLLVSFVALPYLGVELSAVALACVNLAVAAIAWLPRSAAPADAKASARATTSEHASDAGPTRIRAASALVFLSGFVSFGLEVAWFRALRSAFLSTTQSFAIMLASVLLPLAAGARLAAWLAKKKVSLGVVLAAAGVAILVATPIVERFDRIADATIFRYWATNAAWLGVSLLVLGPAMLLLGTCLPWILAEHVEPARWGRSYAVNTIGAVAGSVAAAWVLLPALGFTRSAWLLGAAVVLAAVASLEGRARARAAVAGGAALLVAFFGDTGIGRAHVLGNFNSPVTRVLAFDEGPSSSVVVADTQSHARMLVIDGFSATDESANAHYMVWMGRLPMVLHPDPKRALVICFGTGQTANAVRLEKPESLDVVELNPAVLEDAHFFAANQRVLEDPRVHAHVMDGRAWLRRMDRTYDVITLEPMPPNFAGVNSLYSREFYRLAASRLAPGGIVAQWVPFHLLSAYDAVAITATFHSVFPDSLLWIDPRDHTGIVVGRRGPPTTTFATAWPGLDRPGIERDLDAESIVKSVALSGRAMLTYGDAGAVITDDNQLLSYGPRRHRAYTVTNAMLTRNLAIVYGFAAASSR
jgi:spermidine synthase